MHEENLILFFLDYHLFICGPLTEDILYAGPRAVKITCSFSCKEHCVSCVRGDTWTNAMMNAVYSNKRANIKPGRHA